MNRAVLRQAVLMNWRGSFYQPYELDPSVTALEGGNGAGKTTVMIAIYVALLPDLRLLRFGNVSEGEGGGTDRGLQGRLGSEGNAYSVLDLVTPAGERLIAGVQLVPHARSQIELRPFLIEGLEPETPLEKLLLVEEQERERIPELIELRQQALRLGARLEGPLSEGDYLHVLFERGVLPMRLEHTLERQKFNQLLRTSMYGGLSGSIQRTLKDYLLNEDNALRSLVGSMRENLDACRVTRRELERTQNQLGTIRRIYDAGHGMLEAGFHATRVRARELRQVLEASVTAHRQGKMRRLELESELGALEHQHSALLRRVESCRAQAVEAKEVRERIQIAWTLTRRRTQLQAPLEVSRQALEAAANHRTEADASYQAARQRLEAALREREHIVGQLSDVRAAWETLAAEVAQYQAAARNLEDAQKALPQEEVTPESAEALHQRCESTWEQALDREGRCQQALDTAEHRTRRFRPVFDALLRLADGPVAEAEAADFARLVEEELYTQERQVKEGATLPEQIMETDRRLNKQRSILDSIKDVFGCESIETADGLREAFRTTSDEVEGLSQARDTIRERLALAKQSQQELISRLGPLEETLKTWNRVRAQARALEVIFATSLPDSGAVAGLRQRLEIERQVRARRSSDLEAQLRDKRLRLMELDQSGGRLSTELLALADRLGADLLLGRYDDLDETEAAETEAKLGPLTGALVVEDRALAGAALAGIAHRPSDIWLVDAEQARRLPESRRFADAVLVDMGVASRLSSYPERPVVGRGARERERGRLKQEISALERTLEEDSDALRDLKERWNQVEALWQKSDWLDRPDLEPEVQRLKRELRQAQLDESSASSDQSRADSQWTAARRRRQQLEKLLPEAELLDLRDLAGRLRGLRSERERLKHLAARLESRAADRAVLREGHLELLSPPPLPERLEHLREERDRARASLEHWRTARQLLETLCCSRDAFRFASSVPLLEQKQGALAEIQRRQEPAERAYYQAREHEAALAEALDQALSVFHEADAHFTSRRSEFEDLVRQLEAVGGATSEAELEAAGALVEETEAALSDADRAERTGQQQVTRVKTLLEAHTQTLERLRQRRRDDQMVYRPSVRNFSVLRRALAEQGGLDGLMAQEIVQVYDRRGSVNSSQEASVQREKLLDSLRIAEKAADVLAAVEAATRDVSDRLRGLQFLDAWRLALAYLSEIMPRDVVQADDPRKALEQLERHLHTLQDRLARGEQQLRHSSESIANSIASKINREETLIQRLNRDLRDVSFGSIRGLRIHLERIEIMRRLLSALHEQKEQLSLFARDMPLEEAMLALYRQLGGGQIRGDQLLDYREYLRLTVQIQRLGSERWEAANPSGLSTGESIGIGASILLVILDAWEGHASLYRTGRLNSSLRFLFLDEATRLSADSLTTLLEFCERKKLQLLIAAPAVDRARKGTTYRLERTTDASGREAVVVRGRRGFHAAETSESPP